MESFNLGALVLALFVGLWVVYALPKIADRRVQLSEGEKISRQQLSRSARDLTEACRNAPSHHQREEHVMRTQSSLLRPADPTRRPRLDLPEGSKGVGEQVVSPTPSHSGLATALLMILGVATLALVATTALQLTPVWAPLVACAALFGLIGVQRLLAARTEKRHVHEQSAGPAAQPGGTASEAEREGESADQASEQPSDLAAQAKEQEAELPRELTFAERHELYVREVMAKRSQVHAQQGSAEDRTTFRYGALSSRTTLESAHVEEQEALVEDGSYRAKDAPIFADGLTLDQVLERRRA